jgi:NAD(P)-dependent dehydrogenase (short-subunit alcohol dehydrogenase family)
MNELNYLKEKNVLVTGGTSGLGLALAIQLNELGARVAILARDETNIKRVTERYPKIVGIQGDVSKKENIYPLAGEIHSRLGDVDILLNVASYLGQTPLRFLVDTECEDFELALQTNLLGPFRLTKALLPSMLLRGHGIVVNISSDAAVNPYPKWGGYAISKAGVDHMSRIFDEELKDQGVRFLSIDPGDMKTPMHFAAIPDANPDNLRGPADSAHKILQLISRQDFSQVRRTI